MKKISLFILVLLGCIACSNQPEQTDRAKILKIYNWADYIDMDNVLNSFPQWYKEQTGEDVEIVYQTFDINESMLTQIEVGKEDYDVICPSEYIIERMLRQGLLQPINKDFGQTPDYTQLVSPFAIDKFQQMAPDDKTQVSDYAVGYMWGTTGVLYNPNFVQDEELSSWSFLENPRFKDKIYMKDAFRDIYSVAVLYAYKEELEKGEEDINELVAHITPERLARVEQVLVNAKENIAGWEVDFGKEDMTKGKTWLNVSWSGDAQWAIDEAREVNLELRYTIPEEGSNVWFDGWCIPKYAKNTKAASYFINYMCMPENAILNMEEIGYVSVIAAPEILDWADDSTAVSETVDLSYFFGAVDSARAKAVYANQVFYPDQTIIANCALMHDCGDQTEEMLSMWNRIKGDNLSTGIKIFLFCFIGFVVGIVGVGIWRSREKKKKKQRNRKTKR